MDRRRPKNDPKTDNPFSFRNFLTTPNNGESSTHNHPSTSQTPPRPNNATRTTNPYSFARFIQNTDHVRPVNTVRGDNTILIQGELPDFVQDHVINNGNNDDNSTHSNGLPDFTLHTTNNNIESPIVAPIVNQINIDTISSSSSHDSFIEDISSSRLPVSNSSNLPDFLSDTGIIISKDTLPSQHATTSIHRLSDSYFENGGLNSHMHANGDDHSISDRVLQLQDEVSQKNARILLLEQQMLDQKRKETEETEMMETVMRQVDENLQTAVERWHRAESEVERLRVLVKQLEKELERQRNSQGTATPMHLVRDLGIQISSDLYTADTILKRLLEHSDKMKVMAGHLQSLDRVEERSDPIGPSRSRSPTNHSSRSSPVTSSRSSPVTGAAAATARSTSKK